MTLKRKRSSEGCMGRIYIAVLAAMMIIGFNSPSEGANSTVAGIVSGRSTDATSIQLSMPYTGDDNANNTYTIDYKTCASGTWTNWVTNAPHSPSPYTASITGLTNNQCYSIQATYTDSDGISGRNPQTMQISAGWDNTLLHNSNRFPGTTKWSGDWGTLTGQYSRIVCETCHTRVTANVKRVKDTVITAPNSPAQRFPAESGGMAPVFLSVTAPNGFGDDTGGHSSSQKICEVCHSQNIYHNFSTANNTGDLNHNNNTDCITCHTHKSGFSASCSVCHGNPPSDNATLVFSPGTTGSVTAGAHAVHSGTKQYPCSYCHYNSAGSGPMHNDGPPQVITMGFSLFGGAYTGGIYNGQTLAVYDSSQAGTTVSNNGAKNCVNVYCHGSSMSPNNGTNTTPMWDNASTGACGNCHGATAANPPLRGSHRTHVMNNTWTYDPGRFNPPNPYIYGRNLACTTCHSTNAIAHVNGQADWSFNVPGDSRLVGATYRGSSGGASATAPGTYGQCANLYCHSIAQTSTGGPLTGLPGEYQTPTWGALTEGTCGSCHYADQGHSWFAGRGTPGNYAPYIASGSHTKHLQSRAGSDPVGMDECAVCHNYTGSDALNGCASVCHSRNDLHVNHEIDVKFPATLYGANAAYNGTPAPGDGYGACSNTYCHGSYPGSGKNATPTWGNSSTAACGTCHGAGNTEPPTSGNHGRHAGIGTTVSTGNREYRCTLCHAGIIGGNAPDNYSITDTAKHANNTVDWSFDTSDNRLSANPIYSIISGVQPPSDGTTPRVYGTCTNVYCHSNVQPDGGVGAPTYDAPQWGDTTGGWGSTCSTCHNSGGHLEIYTGGHQAHIRNYYFGYSVASTARKCSLCHKYNAAAAYSSCNAHCHISPDEVLRHADGKVDVAFDTVKAGSSASYDGTPAPGDGYGICSSTYCHSNGTSVATGTIPANISPNWGAGIQLCDSCHTGGTATGPTYSSGSPKANSHNKHVAVKGYTCTDCHSAVVNSGVIINAAKHVNVSYDVSGVNITSYTFATDGGTCAAYCHGPSTPKWGGTVVCGDCHAATNETLTTGTHATHLVSARGPNGVVSTSIYCGKCHGTGAATGTHAGHADGVVTFGDGNLLSTTNVCDTCHSPEGLYDGISDPVIGAKANWTNGVYAGNALRAGKEKWCATCHDAGTSVIVGRQAPDVVGDGINYGYYKSGHGSKTTECDGCHGLTMNHNFDGKKTYLGASNNYQAGFRLKDALTVPLSGASCNSYNKDNYKLCYNCHSESDLMSDTKDRGCYDCLATPTNFKNAPAIVTNFRNMHPQGHNTGTGINDMPANFHADHLIDVRSFGSFWYSDGPGTTTGTSAVTCTTCHNPHGEKLASSNNSAPRMTRGYYDISINNTDSYGQYGQINGTGWYSTCAFACHGAGEKWYKSSVPYMQGITVADNVSNDPAAAEANYTNNRTIRVTLRVSGDPTDVMFAEDLAFTSNPTAWLPFATSSTYTLTDAEGAKRVYAKTRNSFGESNTIQSLQITLDTTPPTVSAAALTSPNGTEVWDQGTGRNITWSGITDTYLKAAPVSLSYSTDSGSLYPNSIASGEANDGTYSWSLPLINSTTVRVRVTATDRAGNQSSDTSNSNFTVRAVTPNITGFTVSDNSSADPAPAEAGYTNARGVNVAISASNYPTEMILAEDSGFTTNSTGWIPFSTSSTYTLTDSDASKTVYLKLRNASGESGTGSYVIILDRVSPAILGTTLTAPNGAEQWMEGETTRQLTWASENITDSYLKASPITFAYSVDAGGTYPYTIAGAIANSGSYSWNPIPKPASYQARVRITATDRAGNQASDSSNANFIIKPLYIVTNTNDSGAGSLRQAMTDLIAAGGNDSIWFDIPVGFLTNGAGVINLATVLPAISSAGITIDGGSQTVLRGDTNTRGPEIRLHGAVYAFDGLTVSASNATIKGLQLTNFYFYGINVASGSNAVIEGNHIGFWSDSVTNYSAGANYLGIGVYGGGSNHIITGNYVSGNVNEAMYIFNASGVSILNNTLGLYPNGAARSNGAFDNVIYISSASNSLIQGNTISGGAYMSGIYAADVNTLAIKGNIFGLYFNGSTWAARDAQATAVNLNNTGVRDVVIGGQNTAASDSVLNDSNVISSTATGIGINVTHNWTYPTKIYGNFIGINPGLSQTFSGGIGINLSGIYATYTVIGGSGSGEAGNTIAHMSNNGVYVNTNATGVKISRNSFFNNGTSASASNDAIYIASGANLDVSRPVISSATASSISMSGIESGDTIEVYISDYDGSGTEYGEGRTFIGSAVAGGTTLNVNVSGVSVGQWVTALRIKSTGDASPFSANFQVQ